MMNADDAGSWQRGAGIVPAARQQAGCPRHCRIVLSGPESSGKSTLAAALANHLGMPMAPEFARFHLEDGQPYPATPGDITELARQHLAWQLEHVPFDAPCGIFDTDLLNYFIWAEVAFGHVPAEIEQGFAAETHHIHLLCEPDLAWQPDPFREFPDLDKRWMLFNRYRQELERRGINYFMIRGEGEKRFALAADFCTGGWQNFREHQESPHRCGGRE